MSFCFYYENMLKTTLSSPKQDVKDIFKGPAKMIRGWIRMAGDNDVPVRIFNPVFVGESRIFSYISTPPCG